MAKGRHSDALALSLDEAPATEEGAMGKPSAIYGTEADRLALAQAEAEGFTWIKHPSQESVTRRKRSTGPLEPRHERTSVQLRRLTRLAVWPGVESLPMALAEDLSPFLNTELAITTVPADDLGPLIGAALTLTQPEARTEVTITVSMSAATATQIVEASLGEADESTLGEFLCESANLAGGALKRCVLDSTSLTLGLPTTIQGFPTKPMPDLLFDLVADGVAVRCTVTSRWAAVVLIPLSGLREGMVVATVIKNGEEVLAEAGQRLTSSTIDVLRVLLDGSQQIQVVDGT